MNALQETIYKDDFEVMFRRHGWLSFSHAPLYTDPQILSLRWIASPTGKRYSPDAIFSAFGNNTFRKVLRAIFDHSPRTHEQLQAICSNEQLLDEHLTFMKDQELAVEEAGLWSKAPRYAHVPNIGRTLEWYVAEWFRSALEAPARHGVHVDDLAEGGDLDVVAFVDGMRVWVECKSGGEITERHLDLFLQRAQEFSPAMAILLIDTDSSIEHHIALLNKLGSAMGNPLSPQNPQNTLYWGMRRVYVVNTKKSIAHALAMALRLYHSKIRYLAFWE